MLPNIYAKNYQEFLILLRKMQQNLKSPENLQEIYLELKQLFQEKIMNLIGEDLEGKTYQNWQSLQTEIHRSFKLLETQVMFFSTSRNSTTNQKYLTQINNYLNNLISYCQKLTQNEEN